MTSSLPFFRNYTLKDEDSVRLFTIHTDDDDVKDLTDNAAKGIPPIAISLLLACMSEYPTYYAISYSPGNPLSDDHPYHERYDVDAKFEVACNGERLQISQNLYEALWMIRRAKSGKGLFWADAICVDHSDDSSETDHIYNTELHAKVFRRASYLLAWLGKSDPTTRTAYEALKDPGLSLERPSWIAAYGVSRANVHVMKQTLERFPPDQLRAIDLLLQRRWFRCASIMSHCAAAWRVLLLCGHFRIDGRNAVALADMTALVSMDPVAARAPAADDHVDMDVDVSAVTRMAEDFCASGLRGFVHDAHAVRAVIQTGLEATKSTAARQAIYCHAVFNGIHDARMRVCGSPTDRWASPMIQCLPILATKAKAKCPTELLAIIGSLDQYIPSRDGRAGSQKADPTLTMFVNLTQIMIRLSGSLDILCRATRISEPNYIKKDSYALRQYSIAREALPSWVPDLLVPSETSLLDDIRFRTYCAGDFLGPMSYEKDPPKEDDKGRLAVGAVFVCQISKLSSYIGCGDTMSEWLSMCRSSKAYQNDTQLGLNQDDIVHGLLSGAGGRFLAAKYRMEAHVYRKTVMQYAAELTDKVPAQYFVPPHPRVQRRMVLCSKHVQNALVPVQAQESDFICVFRGAKVPFVVRPSTFLYRYTLVGEAFVEGLMRGEAAGMDLPVRAIRLE